MREIRSCLLAAEVWTVLKIPDSSEDVDFLFF